jgi:hypothetical protein
MFRHSIAQKAEFCFALKVLSILGDELRFRRNGNDFQLAGLALGFEVPGWPAYPESAAATINGIQELAGDKTIQMSARYSTSHRTTSFP